MPSQEEIKNALSGSKTYDTNTGDSTTDYYNALKNESYKSLLNSEVQASIARDQAMKYTQNSLRAKGYGNQGLAESTNLGLQSQYQTALANAANNYQSSIKGINEQHRQEQLAQQNDNFQSMTTLMKAAAESGDANQLNDIIKTYGYGELKNGAMNWANLDNSDLDENSKKQIKILYNMYNSQLNSAPRQTLNSLDSINSATYIAQGEGNKVSTLGEHFNEEMKYLWHKGSNGQYQKGEVIQVNNGNGDTIFMEWTGNGFTLVDSERYVTAGIKHTLSWNSKTKSISYK